MAEARSYPPTPRRLARARAEGRVARSPMPVLGLMLLTVGAWLRLAPGGIQQLADWLGQALAGPGTGSMGAWSLHRAEALLAPLAAGLLWGLVAMLLALLTLLPQVGGLWAPGAVRPSADRLNATHRLKQLLSSEPIAELLFRCASMAVLCGSVAIALRSAPRGVLSLMERSPVAASQLASLLLSELLLYLGSTLMLLGIVDRLRRGLRLRRALNMTRSERDRERCQDEADPRWLAQRRRGWADGRP